MWQEANVWNTIQVLDDTLQVWIKRHAPISLERLDEAIPEFLRLAKHNFGSKLTHDLTDLLEGVVIWSSLVLVIYLFPSLDTKVIVEIFEYIAH